MFSVPHPGESVPVTKDELAQARADMLREKLPVPQPLDAPPKLPPWPAGKILPPAMEDLGLAFADRLCIDPAPVMASMLTAVTAVLGGRVWVAPDRDNATWVEPVGLWTVNVAPVSYKKTPILKLSLGPIAEIEEALRQEYRVEKANYDLQVAKLKKGDPRPPQPVQKRLLTQDATKESLGKLLVDNPALLSYHDELTGLFYNWQQKGREAERAFFLSAYSASPITVDRITREGNYAPQPVLSLLGFIQPGPFRQIVMEAQQDGRGADGLLQRFLVVVAEEREWSDNRPTVPQSLLEGYHGLVHALWEEYQSARITLTLSREAQELWWDWEREVELEIRNPDLPDSWKAYLGKRLGLTARFAGNLAALWGEKEISALTLVRAIVLVRWSEPHAATAWRRAIHGDLSKTLKVAEKLKKRELTKLSHRELYHKNIAGIQNSKEAQGVLQHLLEAGWIYPDPESKGRDYLVNPAVWEVEE